MCEAPVESLGMEIGSHTPPRLGAPILVRETESHLQIIVLQRD